MLRLTMRDLREHTYVGLQTTTRLRHHSYRGLDLMSLMSASSRSRSGIPQRVSGVRKGA